VNDGIKIFKCEILFLKNDYPMQINYNPTNFSEVKYILAPRAD